MLEFGSFFLILLAALSFSALLGRLHFPWVLALIIGGIFLGPHGFHVLRIDPVIQFFGNIGLVFLMFMAGLETPLKNLRENVGTVSFIAFLNGFIPFLVGTGIGMFFDYGLTQSLLIGIVFISSSVAVVIPTLEANRLIETSLGQTVIGTTILQDLASLLLLSIFLQTVSPVTEIPLLLFYILLFIVLLVGRWAIQRLQKFLKIIHSHEEDPFEYELRIVFIILLGTVILFELMGLHPIIAGFFAGLVLSDSLKSEIIRQKLHAISYGLFIPVFFIAIGMNTDLSVFTRVQGTILLTIVIVVSSVFSKFFSGWIAAKMRGYTNGESSLIAATSIPQLSTTLAVVYTGLTAGYIEQNLATAMITLSIVTTFIAPILNNTFIKRSPSIQRRIRAAAHGQE